MFLVVFTKFLNQNVTKQFQAFSSPPFFHNFEVWDFDRSLTVSGSVWDLVAMTYRCREKLSPSKAKEIEVVKQGFDGENPDS